MSTEHTSDPTDTCTPETQEQDLAELSKALGEALQARADSFGVTLPDDMTRRAGEILSGERIPKDTRSSEELTSEAMPLSVGFAAKVGGGTPFIEVDTKRVAETGRLDEDAIKGAGVAGGGTVVFGRLPYDEVAPHATDTADMPAREVPAGNNQEPPISDTPPAEDTSPQTETPPVPLPPQQLPKDGEQTARSSQKWAPGEHAAAIRFTALDLTGKGTDVNRELFPSLRDGARDFKIDGSRSAYEVQRRVYDLVVGHNPSSVALTSTIIAERISGITPDDVNRALSRIDNRLQAIRAAAEKRGVEVAPLPQPTGPAKIGDAPRPKVAAGITADNLRVAQDGPSHKQISEIARVHIDTVADYLSGRSHGSIHTFRAIINAALRNMPADEGKDVREKLLDEFRTERRGIFSRRQSPQEE
jgi:hypothetical protein